MIAGFKSTDTKRINESHQTSDEKLWHRNDREHVIRNEHNRHRNPQTHPQQSEKREFDDVDLSP